MTVLIYKKYETPDLNTIIPQFIGYLQSKIHANQNSSVHKKEAANKLLNVRLKILNVYYDTNDYNTIMQHINNVDSKYSEYLNT